MPDNFDAEHVGELIRCLAISTPYGALRSSEVILTDVGEG